MAPYHVPGIAEFVFGRFGNLAVRAGADLAGGVYYALVALGWGEVEAVVGALHGLRQN